MTTARLSDYLVSEEAPKEHVIEVHYQDLKKDSYQKEQFTGTKLDEVVDDAFKRINEISKEENEEFKFVGFPSDDD